MTFWFFLLFFFRTLQTWQFELQNMTYNIWPRQCCDHQYVNYSIWPIPCDQHNVTHTMWPTQFDLQGHNFNMAQAKWVISAQQNKVWKNLIAQTFSPIFKLQMKEKKIFRKPDRKRNFTSFAMKEITSDLRALLLRSKSRKNIPPFIGTNGFKNAKTSPKYH